MPHSFRATLKSLDFLFTRISIPKAAEDINATCPKCNSTLALFGPVQHLHDLSVALIDGHGIHEPDHVDGDDAHLAFGLVFE